MRFLEIAWKFRSHHLYRDRDDKLTPGGMCPWCMKYFSRPMYRGHAEVTSGSFRVLLNKYTFRVLFNSKRQWPVECLIRFSVDWVLVFFFFFEVSWPI